MRIVRPLWLFHWDNILNRIYKIEKMKMLGKSDGWILTLERGITLVISYIRFHVYPTSVQLGCCPSARGHDKWKWQLLWIMFLNQQFVFLGVPVFTVCTVCLSDLKQKWHLCPKFMVNLCFYLIICLAVHERAPPVFTLEACFQ